MIDESTIQDAPEVSAVRFMESMKKKMELLLRTGDVAQGPSRGSVSNQKIVTDPEEEQETALSSLLSSGKRVSLGRRSPKILRGVQEP
jgi:hypothetical protein